MQIPAILRRPGGTCIAGRRRGGPSLRALAAAAGCLGAALCFSSCASSGPKADLVVSAADQKLALIHKGTLMREYNISTSKFGLGDDQGSYRTPVGRMTVAKKIGGGLAQGSVLKSRRPTGEILKPNSPGRDPIVTRILWLKGTEERNENAYARCIYIHGTPEERTIGTPSSYGCIRMRSRDVADLYQKVGVGSNVYVMTSPLEGPGSVKRFSASGARGSANGWEILERAIANTGSEPPEYFAKKYKTDSVEDEPAIVIEKAEVLEPVALTSAPPPAPVNVERKERIRLLDPFGLLPVRKDKDATASRPDAVDAQPVDAKAGMVAAPPVESI